jgi:hypothetical protein
MSGRRVLKLMAALAVIVLVVGAATAAFAFFSASTNVKVSAAGGTLHAPTGLTSNGTATATTVPIKWNAPDNFTPTSYGVLRCKGSGCTPTTAIANGSCASPVSGTSCTDNDVALTGATTYVYAVVAALNNWVSPASATFTTSTAGTQAPTITSASSATFTIGSSTPFTVTTTGTPTVTTITNASFGGCTASALPASITFTDNGNGTATIAGTPAALTQGVYTLCLTASNGVAPNARQTFTLTVKEPDATTTFTTAGQHTLLVPPGTTSVTYELVGAGGGGGKSGNSGGAGAKQTGTINLSSNPNGTVLTVWIGGAGASAGGGGAGCSPTAGASGAGGTGPSGGNGGGGGGGASCVLVSTSPIAIAGGGGGGGGGTPTAGSGVGGAGNGGVTLNPNSNAGANGAAAAEGGAGGGGGTNATTGVFPFSVSNTGGGGGTGAAGPGGTGGTGTGTNAGGNGGTHGSSGGDGGGGGGGYASGGGGAGSNTSGKGGAGGGGGAGYTGGAQNGTQNITLSNLTITQSGDATAGINAGIGGGHDVNGTAGYATFTGGGVTSPLKFGAIGSAQTWGASSSTQTVTYPTSAAGDLLFLVAVNKANVSTATPTGWTQIANQGPAAYQFTVWTKVAAGGTDTSVSLTGSNMTAWGIRYTRDGSTLAPSVQASVQQGNAAAAANMTPSPNLTTSFFGSTVISLAGNKSGNNPSLSAAQSFTLQSGTNSGGLAEGIADQFVATSGSAPASPTWAISSSGVWAWATIAIF